MKPAFELHRVWPKVVGSAAVGAAAMYVLDPDRGRRRRAIARDKARSVVHEGRDLVSGAARDFSYRIKGIQAEARRRFRRHEIPDDLVLIERVRAKMGRIVSHPHAIQVGAENGRITLSGPILASEVQPLLQAAQSVPDVLDIEDHLVAHQSADSIPSLQGGSLRPDLRPLHGQRRWSPAMRLLTFVGGGLLAAYGVRQRGLAGVTLATIAAGLTACAAGKNDGQAKRLGNDRRSKADANDVPF